MNKISNLRNADGSLIAELRKKNVRTTEDLWEQIGPKFKSGLTTFAGASNIPQESLISILIAGCSPPTAKSSKKADRFKFWVATYWKEPMGALMLVAVLFVLVLNALTKQEIVVVRNDFRLWAPQVITASQLTTERKFKTNGTFAKPENVAGRLLVVPATPGSILLESQLGPAGLDGLSERYLVTLPIKAIALGKTIVPGSRVRLVFSSRTSDPKTDPAAQLPAASIDDVIILAINRQGDSSSIEVAIKNQNDPTRVAFVSANAEILIVQYAALGNSLVNH